MILKRVITTPYIHFSFLRSLRPQCALGGGAATAATQSSQRPEHGHIRGQAAQGSLHETDMTIPLPCLPSELTELLESAITVIYILYLFLLKYF